MQKSSLWRKIQFFKIIYLIKKVKQDQALVEFKVLEDRHVEKNIFCWRWYFKVIIEAKEVNLEFLFIIIS